MMFESTSEGAATHKYLFTISDGTGETAMGVLRAVMVQFEGVDISLERFNKVRTQEQIESILHKACTLGALVVITMVDTALRVFLITNAMQLGVRVVDVLFPLLESVSQILGTRPNAVSNLLRKLDEGYFHRIAAMEYTMRHDDGQGLFAPDFHEADVVLLGVSRTSKTPLSMYLGHKGYKVANVPVLPYQELPKEIFALDPGKVVGLLISPQRLVEIRTARLEHLSTEKNATYGRAEQIYEELAWCQHLFQQNPQWRILDVTGKALEETAVDIERLLTTDATH